MKNKELARKNRRFLVGLAVFAVLAILANYLSDDTRNPISSSSRSSEVSQKKPASSKMSSRDTKPDVGSRAILHRSDGKDCILAFTEDGLTELLRVARAGGDRGIVVWLLEGNGFLAPSGTPVAVIDRKFGAREVMILGGSNPDIVGHKGWIPTEFLIKDS